MTILKEEINTCLAAMLDLSKWKLAVMSVLAAAGLGILKDVQYFSYGYLLLFMAPFLCAFIDLLIYEREARIHQIAKYLRHYSGDDTDCTQLQKYESYINQRRIEAKRTWVPYEHVAQIASSVLASVFIPLLAYFVEPYRKALEHQPWLVSIPIFGITLVISFYLVALWQVRKLSKLDPIRSQAISDVKVTIPSEQEPH